MDVRKVVLRFFVFVFFISLLSTGTSGLMYSSGEENRKPHTSHMPSPSDLGATIFRMTVVLIVHRHPLSSSPTHRECGRSPGQSQDLRRSLSSFIAVVVNCRRRWLSTTSHFIVVVHHRCRSWSWSCQTSRSSSSLSSTVVVRCHHDFLGYKRPNGESGIKACSIVFPNITYTRVRSLMAPCMGGTLMVRRWRNGKS